jgi:transketolase C-terminal domain/subunit
MIGVRDRFGESGRPWQLIRKYGLAAEQIAKKAMEILGIR